MPRKMFQNKVSLVDDRADLTSDLNMSPQHMEYIRSRLAGVIKRQRNRQTVKGQLVQQHQSEQLQAQQALQQQHELAKQQQRLRDSFERTHQLISNNERKRLTTGSCLHQQEHGTDQLSFPAKISNTHNLDYSSIKEKFHDDYAKKTDILATKDNMKRKIARCSYKATQEESSFNDWQLSTTPRQQQTTSVITTYHFSNAASKGRHDKKQSNTIQKYKKENQKLVNCESKSLESEKQQIGGHKFKTVHHNFFNEFSETTISTPLSNAINQQHYQQITSFVSMTSQVPPTNTGSSITISDEFYLKSATFIPPKTLIKNCSMGNSIENKGIIDSRNSSSNARKKSPTDSNDYSNSDDSKSILDESLVSLESKEKPLCIKKMKRSTIESDDVVATDTTHLHQKNKSFDSVEMKKYMLKKRTETRKEQQSKMLLEKRKKDEKQEKLLKLQMLQREINFSDRNKRTSNLACKIGDATNDISSKPNNINNLHDEVGKFNYGSGITYSATTSNLIEDTLNNLKSRGLNNQRQPNPQSNVPEQQHVHIQQIVQHQLKIDQHQKNKEISHPQNIINEKTVTDTLTAGTATLPTTLLSNAAHFQAVSSLVSTSPSTVITPKASRTKHYDRLLSLKQSALSLSNNTSQLTSLFQNMEFSRLKNQNVKSGLDSFFGNENSRQKYSSKSLQKTHYSASQSQQSNVHKRLLRTSTNENFVQEKSTQEPQSQLNHLHIHKHTQLLKNSALHNNKNIQSDQQSNTGTQKLESDKHSQQKSSDELKIAKDSKLQTQKYVDCENNIDPPKNVLSVNLPEATTATLSLSLPPSSLPVVVKPSSTIRSSCSDNKLAVSDRNVKNLLMEKITDGHANEVGKPLDADGETLHTNENIAGLFSGGMLNYFRIPDDLKHLDNLSITDETTDDISMTTLTDGDVEYSLREVFPSEDLCKKLRKQASSGALTNNASKANDIEAKSSRKHSKLFFGADDSLNDFNISMAKSYIFQEEVRQELKTSMKKVKEEALALGGNVKSKSSSLLYHGHHPLRTHQQPNLQQPPNLQLQQPPLSSSRQEQPPTSTTQVFKKTFSSIKKGADDVYPSYKFERNEEQFDDKSITAYSESELSSASSCQNIEDSLVCLRNDEKTSGVRNKMLLKKLRDGFKHEERYLTKREQMLKDRKAKALELLKRSKKLDEEEEEVKKLEKEASLKIRELSALRSSQPLEMVSCHNDGIAFTRCQPTDRKRSEGIDLLQADKQEQQHETQVENLFLTIIQAKSRNELIEIIQECQKKLNNLNDLTLEQPTFQQQHQQQFLQKKLEEEAKLQQPNKLLPEHHIPISSSNVDAMQNDKQHKHNFGQTGTTIDFVEKQMNEDSLTGINSALSCLRYTLDEEKKQKDASPKHSEVEERLAENTDEVKSSEEDHIELTIVEGRHKVTIEQKSSSNPFLINSLNNENEENKDQTNCHSRDLFEQKQVENESKKDFDVDVDIEKDNQTVIQQNLNQVNKENCSQHQYDIPQNTMNSSKKQLINAFDCITTKRNGDAICGHHQNEDDQSIYPPNNQNPVDRQNLLKQQYHLQQCESEPQVIMPLSDESLDKQSHDEIISKSEENMKQSLEPVVIKKQLDEGQRSTVTSQLLDNETVEIRLLGSHKSSDNVENFNEISDIKSFACNQKTNILEIKLDCNVSTSIKLEDVDVRESVEEVMKEEPPPRSLTSSSSLSTPSSVDSLVSKAASKDIHRSARKQPEVKSFVEAASHHDSDDGWLDDDYLFDFNTKNSVVPPSSASSSSSLLSVDSLTSKDRLNKEVTTIATDSSVGAIVPAAANDDHNRKTADSVEMESPPPHPVPPRATQRVLTFVPTDTSTLRELISQSLDIYWNLRRFGESWVDQPAPHSFLISCQSRKSSNGTNDVVRTTSLMPCEVTFRRMIFEYVGEVLIDIYSREDSVCCEGNDQLQSYNHAGLFTGPVKYLAYKNYNLKRRLATKKLPHILDELKPIVIDLILSSLPNQFTSTMASATTKTSKMDHNKNDFVEQLLARDLKVEEEGWIDYDDDVEDVKTAAFESLYQTLLDETLSTVSRVFDKRCK